MIEHSYRPRIFPSSSFSVLAFLLPRLPKFSPFPFFVFPLPHLPSNLSSSPSPSSFFASSFLAFFIPCLPLSSFFSLIAFLLYCFLFSRMLNTRLPLSHLPTFSPSSFLFPRLPLYRCSSISFSSFLAFLIPHLDLSSSSSPS